MKHAFHCWYESWVLIGHVRSFELPLPLPTSIFSYQSWILELLETLLTLDEPNRVVLFYFLCFKTSPRLLYWLRRAVLLWSSRNYLWKKKLRLTFHQQGGGWIMLLANTSSAVFSVCYSTRRRGGGGGAEEEQVGSRAPLDGRWRPPAPHLCTLLRPWTHGPAPPPLPHCPLKIISVS